MHRENIYKNTGRITLQRFIAGQRYDQRDCVGRDTVRCRRRGNGKGDLLESQGQRGARFQIALDTHSVNLDSYDLKTISVLRDDAGNTFSPTSVENKGSGHHRETTVSFAKVASGTKRVELVIKDVAGVKEKIFRWDLE